MTETLDPSKGLPTSEVKKQFRGILERDLTRLAIEGDEEAKSLLLLIVKQDQAEKAKIGEVFDPDGIKTTTIAAATATLRSKGKLRSFDEMYEEAEESLKPKLM